MITKICQRGAAVSVPDDTQDILENYNSAFRDDKLAAKGAPARFAAIVGKNKRRALCLQSFEDKNLLANEINCSHSIFPVTRIMGRFNYSRLFNEKLNWIILKIELRLDRKDIFSKLEVGALQVK